ncbi:MAG: GNAT family N-acetyltransferase [Bacteriovoracaceae bacterium]
MQVLRINPTDTLPIRKQMLRADFPEAECVFEGDDDDLTFHLGGFKDNKLVSVASFYLVRHPEFEEETQYQLRGMATLPEFQSAGFSSALLKTAFPIIKQNQGDILWCNARTSAQGFYEKIGFECHSDVFEIETVGPHVLMAYSF